MTFDLTQPIAFELAEASLERAAEWQALIHQLMTETDTFLVTSVRDGDVIPEVSDGPAITLLLIAEQGTLNLPVGIGSIENGEVGMAILAQMCNKIITPPNIFIKSLVFKPLMNQSLSCYPMGGPRNCNVWSRTWLK